MNSKELLIFDIKGEYGHFRKYNTTTSPLTYSIPTRTAIVGMLGAIIGMEREVSDGVYQEGVIPVQEFFSKKDCDIAVQIMKPIKKVNIGFNLINTKTSFYNLTRAGRTQIEFELVKDVHYRIFLTMANEVFFRELSNLIKNKHHYFTPYLGLAQFTAEIDYIQLTRANEVFSSGAYTEIITAVNISKLHGEAPVEFQREFVYSANNMPITMDRYRNVLEYSEVLIEKSGNSLKVNVPAFYEVDKVGNILFL
ncbi:MAG: type I-B CRISPR-associated protein Cas5b [Sphingobacteriia bacterium]|nr:type I-B CRISPR-associated protein Cas5b [Sphingobacteriia bacterium]